MEKIIHYSEDKAEKEAGKVADLLAGRFPEQNGVFTKEQYDSVEREITERQIELIKKLSSLSVPVYLIGGYASDLLLGEEGGVFNGEFSGPHTDVDMLVESGNLEAIQNELDESGLQFKKTIVGEQVYKLYLNDPSGLEADIGVIEDVGDEFKITMKDGVAHFKKDLILGPEIIFFGQKVRVISPKLLVQSFLFYGRPREKDIARTKALSEKYKLENVQDPSTVILE